MDHRSSEPLAPTPTLPCWAAFVQATQSLLREFAGLEQRVVLCGLALLVLIMQCFPAKGENTDSLPLRLDLRTYLERVLRDSNTAKEIEENLAIQSWDRKLAQAQFNTRIVPLADVGASEGTGTQTLGIKASQKIPFGTEISTGLEFNRQTSNQYVLQNSHTGRAYIQLTQSLLQRFGWRYNRAPLTLVEWQQQKTALTAARERQALLYTAMAEFYQTVLAERAFDAAQLDGKQAQASADRSLLRWQQGQIDETTYWEAELQRQQADYTRKERERDVSRHRDILATRLALSTKRSVEPIQSLELLIPVIPEDWQAELFAYRLDWQQYQIDLEIQRLRVFQARRDRLPDISLNMRVAQEGRGDSFSAARRLDETDWSIQLRLESSLERTHEQARLARENLTRTQLLRQGTAMRRRIEREVADAFAEFAAGTQQRQLAALKWQTAQRELAVTKLQVERGLKDDMAMRAAEKRVFMAETEVVKQLIDANLAAVNLGQALGVLDWAWFESTMAESAGKRTAAEQAIRP